MFAEEADAHAMLRAQVERRRRHHHTPKTCNGLQGVRWHSQPECSKKVARPALLGARRAEPTDLSPCYEKTREMFGYARNIAGL